MSSFIQWPTIYGSAYFLPGIIVVVLLLTLMLLMSSRRRSRAERVRLAPDPLLEAEVPASFATAEAAMPAAVYASPAQMPGIVTQPVTGASRPLEMATQPAVAPALSLVPPPTGPAPVAAAALAAAAAPAPTQSFSDQPTDVKPAVSGRRSKATRALSAVPPVATGMGNDPMNAAIEDILNGWGDLAHEDIKRLELFRPDRLSAALAGVQLSKSRTNETKLRLSQLRQYAGDLERRAHADRVAAAAAAADVAAATAAAAPLAIVPDVPIDAPVAAATILAPADTPVPAPEPPTSADPEGPGGLTADATVEVSKDLSPLEDPAAFWAAPRPLWEPDPGASFEEVPAPAYHEVEMDPVGEHDGNGHKSAAQIESLPVTKHSYTADDSFWEDEPVRALSRLSVKVETAEQLLALPTTERVDMTAFLPPAELVATFRATQDADLKKAVIDTLEHIGSPSSLNALGNCFEDADSGIQMYALAAADRLLGVA
jgi:hypothetical protein